MGSRMGWVHTLWRALGSTWLAAVLLAALLIVALWGSLFPQMPSDPAARQTWLDTVSIRYHRTTHLLRMAGLFELYQTAWFRTLLIILGLVTGICTVQRLPHLRHAPNRPRAILRPEGFYDEFHHQATWPVPSFTTGLAMVQRALRKHGYSFSVAHAPTGDYADLYAEQGRWGQAGTVVSHAAALLLMAALVVRPHLTWQEQNVVLVPGQVHAVGHGHEWAVQAGPLTVDRYPGGEPRQYQVPLTVLLNGSPTQTMIVRLNHPLTVRGVSFHLQGYGPAVEVTAPAGTIYVALVGAQAQEVTVPGSDVRLRVALLPNDESLYVEALTAAGAVLGSGPVADGEQIQVEGVLLTFRISQYTLWQVSHDPTFGWAIAAGAVFLTGVVLSLWIPHRRLWVRIEERQVRLASIDPGTLDHVRAEISAHLLGEGSHGQ